MKSRVIVVGLGRSGIGAAKLLAKNGFEVIVLEQSKTVELISIAGKLRQQKVKVQLGKALKISSFLPWMERLEAVVLSPGIDWKHPVINELRRLGVKVKGEITLAWEELKNQKWIGITGTNGKTTVSHMMNHILQSNNFETEMGGNVGYSATEIALKCKESNKSPQLLVMELSSYQLETAPDIKPYIGIWTTLTEDHLERHGTLEEYIKIKKNLLDNSNICIYNYDDKYLRSQKKILKEGIWISRFCESNSNNNVNIWIDSKGVINNKKRQLFDTSNLPIRGDHNLQNLLLVTAAAIEIGIPAENIHESFKSFKSIPHRLEELADIKGIQIFNDSKATNYNASTVGIKAVKGSIVLICGGILKEGNPDEWIEELNTKVCGIILYGESKYRLKDILDNSNVKIEIKVTEDLDKAVSIGMELAIQTKAKTLLFSPACSSFDQYKNFEERGDDFKRIVTKYGQEPW